MTQATSKLAGAKPIEAYLAYMKDIKRRIAKLCRIVVFQHSPTKDSNWDNEVVYMMLRKTIEELAFTALVAHKDAYAAAHADFETHWKIKKLFERIEKLNADFFPKPLKPATPSTDRVWHFEPRSYDYLTRDELEFLYDVCSEVLHAWNPYRSGEWAIHIKKPIAEWVTRLENLLAFHYIKLLDGSLWLVQMNTAPSGDVTAAQAGPVQSSSAPQGA